MSVCPVCGCKTDELDFVLCNIENNEEMVCSFCEKQVKKFYSDEGPGAAQIRWLASVIEKEVPSRDNNILSALFSMQKKFLPEESIPVKAPLTENQFVSTKKEINTPNPQVNGSTGISVEQYNNLINRIDSLEKKFAKYKKAQLMKTVIELLLPVVMLIAIAIIFFTSGLYDYFVMLSDLI